MLNLSRDSGLSTGSGTTIALRLADTSSDGGAGTWNTTQQFTAVQFFSADASGSGAAIRASVGATMEVASGGGMCSHCFETAREIRAICDSYNIKLIGYADEQACSAAYALLCICDVVVANPSAELGSIGVLVALMDTSEAMKQAGLKRIFITSGTNKVPFADDGTFKKSFLDGLQADVDRLNMEFAEHVSRYTGLSVETIMGFEADTFDAVKAVELGLANSVMTSKEFAEYIIRVKGTQ